MSKPPVKTPTGITGPSRPGVPSRAGSLPALRRGMSITPEGLQAASKQVLVDQNRGKNLDWLRQVRGGLVSFLLDKSGSMSFIKPLVMAGYNDYLGALPGVYRQIGFSLYQFDSESFDTVYEARPVQYVPDMDDASYRPLGGTPLYDSIMEVTRRADKLVMEGQITADRVIITVMSDGGDSTGKAPDEVRTMIQDRERRGYQYQFLGMGIDGYALANSMGIAPSSTMSFDASHAHGAFERSALRQIDYLQGKTKDASFTKEDRKLVNDQHAPKLLK